MNLKPKIRVAVLGATGYTGVELVRLLLQHPNVTITSLTSERSAGEKYTDVFPAFRDQCNLKLEKIHAKEIAKQSNVVFSCLPHQNSMHYVPTLIDYGSKVIDLSADFRLDKFTVFSEWYGDHSSPDLLKEKTYGLPEINRKAIKNAFLVANPGCYPTATILGLAPLLKKELISTNGIICDAKSGASGAGRPPKQLNVYGEVNETLRPYGVAKHRHTPEIEQELSKLADKDLKIRFTPHLIPMDRGIITTLYAKPTKKMPTKDWLQVFEKFYAKEPFVRILDEGHFPNTKHVRGTNYCDIGAHYDERMELIIVTSAIDNLCKGAAGQAVQNMNLMSGLNETTGLIGTALVP